jgi:tetratricopeptide (TPR) repeat protein
MHTIRRLALTAAVLALAATTALAQTRGMGRVGGKVTDENGKAIEDVLVTATMASGGEPVKTKTNKKGEWALGGIAPGSWNVDFEKDGLEKRSITVSVAELTRIPPVEIAMKPAPVRVDPNVEIKAELSKAAGLMGERRYGEARALYEALLAKYPEAYQLHPLIARTYYSEKNLDKAVEHLKLAIEKAPDNIEVKLLLGNTLVEQGKVDEGKQILGSVDPTKITDSTILINVGITLINQSKPAEALTYFDQAIARFPDQPDAYYYRGITHLQLGKAAEAKADLEKFVSIAQADAPELPMAKKILEQIK